MIRRFFVGASAKMRLSELDLAAVASWLDADLWPGPPWPTDRLGLVLTRRGARLHAPGSHSVMGVYWNPGMTAMRLRHMETDPLVRALSITSGDTILDATLGLGHDAMVMASAGAIVEGLEAVPALLYYTLDGLWSHRRDLARRISGRCADHGAFLADAPDRAYGAVYLDPLFPAHQRRESPQWSPLRVAGRAGAVDMSALREAFRVARERVVMKLPPGASPPPISSELTRGPEVVASQRVRFAVWNLEDA